MSGKRDASDRSRSPSRPKPATACACAVLPDKPSIAVLPFQNLSGDPEQEYFADGVVEDIITALVAHPLAVRDRAQFELHLQGPRRRREAGRPRTRRALRAGRQRAQGRRTGCASPASSSTRRPARICGRTASKAALDDIFELQDQITASVVGAIAPQAGTRRDRARQAQADRKSRRLRLLPARHGELSSGHQGGHRRGAAACSTRRSSSIPNFASAYGMAAWCLFWRKTQWLERGSAAGDRRGRAPGPPGRRTRASDDAVALARGGHALAHFTGDLDVGVALHRQGA